MANTPGIPLLRESRISLAEFIRQTHHVTPEEGTKFEDLLREDFWSAVSYKFKPADIIEIHAEDGSYFAELYIRAAGRNWAKVAVLRKVDLDPVEAQFSMPEFETAWKGPARKFAVIRLSDKEIIKDGFDTKEQAADYIRGHVKALAA